VPTSHNQQQVEVEVADAAEIDEIFDIISYSKGCSIVRMLASFLGNDVFKKGLNIYLNRHKYANALTEVPTQLCHPLGFHW
jgi:aminopeptidase N